jgi:CheY-like chemotaxis protein
LRRKDSPIVTIGDGKEALERVKSPLPSPSVILLDLAMARMNGWESLRIKMADPTIAGIPTIVLSASATDLPAGAQNLLGKPVEVDRLLALIGQYC